MTGTSGTGTLCILVVGRVLGMVALPFRSTMAIGIMEL